MNYYLNFFAPRVRSADWQTRWTNESHWISLQSPHLKTGPTTTPNFNGCISLHQLRPAHPVCFTHVMTEEFTNLADGWGFILLPVWVTSQQMQWERSGTERSGRFAHFTLQQKPRWERLELLICSFITWLCIALWLLDHYHHSNCYCVILPEEGFPLVVLYMHTCAYCLFLSRPVFAHGMHVDMCCWLGVNTTLVFFCAAAGPQTQP